ncbi:alpha-2-macroglobulin family protein [Lichenibacterium dinghuense]|uniref:alpha-2-macroglobulin family protein n=1 Tax=Lichenibacterium dinghuense TaxID=2895977 RepID=UPI001F380FA6|nr:alpha-2-macroglobulin [Lichenibacterium sp. 6Y81]
MSRGSLVSTLRRVLIAAALLAPAEAGAVDYLDVAVEPDRAVPAACFSFSAPLPRETPGGFAPFVEVSPAGDHALEPRGRDLCLAGLTHGGRYTVRLKAGLPAADGTALPKDVSVEVAVPDREARVTFDGRKTVLPYAPGVGLPLKSVNVAKARVAVYRIGERALVGGGATDQMGQDLDGYGLSGIADKGAKVFDGTVDIASKPNREVATALPVDALLKGLKPGVYVAAAWPADRQPDESDTRATQWFSVSDVGLVTVKTDGGMLVSARSLRTALPLADVAVALVAKSDEVLATWRTGADGLVTVPAGLLRGEGGDAPRLLTASGPDGSFTPVDLDAPALDLSALDLKGRAPPGPLDAYLWTDRGIYRPGEVLHLGALLRDRDAGSARAPLTLHLVRPDGIEVDRMPLDLARAGGGTLDLHIPDNAYSGEWTLWAGSSGTERLGSATVSVQDFMPPRLEAKLDVPSGALDAAAPITTSVEADYFYGSPGAGLTGQLDATLAPAAHPFAGYEDYSFGLAQEPFLPKALDPRSFSTDDGGRATVAFPAGAAPDTTVPLEVRLKATVNDVDGRPAEAEAVRPLRGAAGVLGLRAAFGGAAAENSDVAFDAVALDPDGHPAPMPGVRWELVLETYTYNAFFRDGRWQFESKVTDTRVDGGDLAFGADGRGRVAARVGLGRYRLEVFAPDGRTATSLRFGSGWWAQAGADDRKPDVLPVSASVGPDGAVEARVEPAFAGRVLAMLDGGGLHQVQEVEVPKGGATISFKAGDVPPAGAYVLAVAVSPSGAVIPRLPVRAVGAAWVPGAAAAHRLDVRLTAPDRVEPKRRLDADVAVAGAAPGESAFVTVAAVDEAVLRMTGFASPDPADHFLGRREPGIEWRDVYGSLLDPEGQPGRLVEGGDARAAKQMGGLDVKTFRTVALFSGPVAVGPDGHARVGFDVPDFSGRLRLMAVAWTADRFGHADAPVTVRPPLLAELTLPRFLAPGDKARVRVMLTDLEAPEGRYRVTVTTAGPVALDKADIDFEDVKRDKRRFVDRTLTATGALGAGHVHLVAVGDDGTRAERDFDIGVRSPNPYVTSREVRSLDPGASLTAGDALGADMLPGTAVLDVSVAANPAFDLPGILAELRRYPYGCAEQTVSRAFPELYAAALGEKAAASVGANPTVQGAVARLYSLQMADGSFGYWSAFDGDNIWLTAYVVDFLQRAGKAGASVPEAMEKRALAWLAGRFAAAGPAPAEVAGDAYAAVVLARANRLDLSQLRYVSTRDGRGMPSEIARLQLAAALTRAGERGEAAAVLRGPPARRDPGVYLDDYGSPLRDRAMALALAAEEKLLPEAQLVQAAADLSHAAAGARYLSTQEEVWVLRAALALGSKGPLDLAVDGRPSAGRPRVDAALPLGQGRAVRIENRGTAPAFVSLATTGVPSGPQPAEANGFTVSRSYLRFDGSAVDLADVHQNDEFVVVVEGTSDGAVQRKALLVDMLPAGLEPGTVGLEGSEDTSSFGWLKDLTEPTFKAVRDDRYVAGFDPGGDRRGFKLAYAVRAVTPGTYALPGPQVEDMYAPAFHARGAAGTLEVKPARKP